MLSKPPMITAMALGLMPQFAAAELGEKKAETALQAAGLDGLDEGQAVNFEIEVANDGRESATNIQLA